MSPHSPSPDQTQSLAQRVQADKIRLLYEQSFLGVFSSLVAAGIWVALMWQGANRSELLIWAGALALAAVVRLVVFVLYKRRATDLNILRWHTPYAWTVLVSALLWGFGTVWVMPADSLLLQACTYVFLVGLAGAALSAYGVFMAMTIAIVSAVLLPIVLFFIYQGGTVQICLALGGSWFFLTTLRSIKVHNATLDESFRLGHALTEAKRIAERQARTDSLTGLNNRRAFSDAAEALLRIAAREKRGAALIVFDIDDFKLINDHHGHAAGDAALVHLSAVLAANLRASDVCSRLGGDEFAVLLPSTTLDAAQEVAEKIQHALQAAPLPIAGGALPFTLSIGIAGDALDVETLLNHADEKMYQAKRAGKNRVVA